MTDIGEYIKKERQTFYKSLNEKIIFFNLLLQFFYYPLSDVSLNQV